MDAAADPFFREIVCSFGGYLDWPGIDLPHWVLPHMLTLPLIVTGLSADLVVLTGFDDTPVPVLGTGRRQDRLSARRAPALPACATCWPHRRPPDQPYRRFAALEHRAQPSARRRLSPASRTYRGSRGSTRTWSLDFLYDRLSNGRRFRILAVVEDFTRECLTPVADASLSGLRVGRELDAIVARRGKPAIRVSDNGAELTSMTILCWLQKAASTDTTSPPVTRSRMPSSRASTTGCATSC